MVLPRLALSRSALDRRAELRAQDGLLDRLAADPATVLLVVHEGRVPVTDGPPADAGTDTGDQPAAGTALLLLPAPEHPDLVVPAPYLIFLGVDGEDRPYLALPVDDPPPLPAGARWAGLREVGAALDDAGVGATTTAVALLAWHGRHGRCAVCGSPTDVVHAGWVRHCPGCGTDHYPRTDPAVIMAIVDDADRILLGRQAAWPEGRFSTLAGFVEPGESLEDAVRREVLEESSVVVGDVTYLGSQPWPFPGSLMLGFRGRATSTEVVVDGDELAQARWWTRDELAADVRAGRVRLPPAVSIARRLVEDWFGAPIEADDTWR